MLFQKTPERDDSSSTSPVCNINSATAGQGKADPPTTPTFSPQLSTSPYRSTFSSFFRSTASTDSLEQPSAADPPFSPSPLPTVTTSTEALVRLESCLDGLKRRHTGSEAHADTNVLDSTPVASPSTMMALSPIQTQNLQLDQRPSVETDLADACGWIFTGLVLEIVSLASESCRAAERIVRGDASGALGADEQAVMSGSEAEERSQETMQGSKDKGKQREQMADPAEGAQTGRRRRRFSLSFNFKGMLNLDDIEERLNEDPETAVKEENAAPDWDILGELLRHLVEIHREDEFRYIETAYLYAIPLDLVFAHSPSLEGPLPVITARLAASALPSPASSPVDRFSCHDDADCREAHTHLSTGRKALTILCGRLKNLIEQREEIQMHGHKTSMELDRLSLEVRERVVWVKACLACCLYLLARSESPSQLYLLQLQELLPTGISHIDYLINDIAATFSTRPVQVKQNQRQAMPDPPTVAKGKTDLGPSPTKSQRTTVRGRRSSLSAKPSSIFSFSSSVFSVGGRFSRPVKSATSLPQLSFEAASSSVPLEPAVGASAMVASTSSGPPLRRAEGARGSAADILQKYHSPDATYGSKEDGSGAERRSPWGRFSSLRSFRRSPLNTPSTIPVALPTSQPVGRSDSEQSLVSVQSFTSRPRNIRSCSIKQDSPPRLSDSVTSEETNESQGLEIPAIKTIACTPSPRIGGMFPRTPPSAANGHLHPRIQGAPRAFENTLAMPPLDPALAAAEKASVLNKKHFCAVCGKQGCNFPACRKCHQTFCSRECRVGFNKGGDGKKHVCGLTKTHSSQLLEVPHPVPKLPTKRQASRLGVN